MKNAKKSIYNIFFSFLSQVIIIALGLFVPKFILQYLGSEMNGLVNSVSQILAYFSLFEAGVQAAAMQALYKPISLNSKSDINAILSAVNKSYKKTGFLYLLSLLVLAWVYPFFIKETTIENKTIFLIILFLGLGNVILFWTQGKYNILLRASGENYVITNTSTVISIVNSISKIILLTLGFNIVVVLAVSFVISLTQSFYLVLYIKRKYKWIDLKAKPDFKSIGQKNSALIHQFSALIFQNTDIIILTIFCNLKIVSVYSIYKLIVGQLSNLLQIPFNSCSFVLGQMFQNDLKKFKRAINMADVYNSGLAFSILSVAYFLLAPFVELYTKGITDVNYVDKYLPILFVIIELLTCIRLPLLNTINYAGHFKNTVAQTIIETVINLTVSLVAVYYLGIYGVLIGTIVALIYRNIDITFYTNKKILKRSPAKTFLIYGVNFILFFVTQLIFNLIPIEVTSYLKFVTVGLIITPISIVLYMLTLSLVFKSEFKQIVNLAKPVVNKFLRK